MTFRNLLLCVLSSLVILGLSGTYAFAAETEDSSLPLEETMIEMETIIATFEGEAETIEETDQEIEEETDKEEKENETAKKTEKKDKKNQYTKAELRLLASLIFCEAGSEPYAGKLAVGIVVVNRKESKKFPDTIKEVIYQKYQFGPARNGSLTKALNRYDNGKFTSGNEKDSIKAAKAALSGDKIISYKSKNIDMSSYLFFSGRVRGAKLSIANHQFK